MEKSKNIGVLFIVSTPIGNLSDITLRALETLKSVDIIAAEDTRVTKRLLSTYKISASIISYREQNRQRATKHIIEILESGKCAALVTDAGTPGISDPGDYLVAMCIEAGFHVVPIPGPSAVLAALSVSGFFTGRFIFLGFLPRKGKKRESAISCIMNDEAASVIYESPKRTRETLGDILKSVGDRRVVLCRELTKVYEEIIRGRISEVIQRIGERDELLGEVVIVIEGTAAKEKSCIDENVIKKETIRVISENPGIKTKDAARIVSKTLGIPIKTAYNEINVIKKEKLQ
jgi:16S rRNA (cytidine1402-2'-O)-methyltransferase